MSKRMPATLEIAAEVLPPEKRPMGRPSLYPTRAPIVLSAIRKGLTRQRAAAKADIDPGTIGDWEAANPEFSREITRAEAEWVEEQLGLLDSCVTKWGTPDPKAMELKLRRLPEFQVHQVTESHTVNVNISLTGDQLASIQAKRRQALEDGK